MHLLRQRQENQFLYIFFTLITSTVSIPIVKQSAQTIRCLLLHQNCTFPKNNSLPSQSLSSPIFSQVQTLSTTLQTTQMRMTSQFKPPIAIISFRPTSWPIPTTSRLRSTTPASPPSDFDSFTENLKRAAFILAAIAVGLGILRVCLMFCKSSSSNSNRNSATVRPQAHTFKPDLPPAYAEAIVHVDNERGNLPSYDELPREQQQPYTIQTHGNMIPTPM